MIHPCPHAEGHHLMRSCLCGYQAPRRSALGPYDFEFPNVPAAQCHRCGALVQNRDLHDAFHAEVLTRDDFIAAISRTVRREGVR